jgi:hypothetical protein
LGERREITCAPLNDYATIRRSRACTSADTFVDISGTSLSPFSIDARSINVGKQAWHFAWAKVQVDSSSSTTGGVTQARRDFVTQKRLAAHPSFTLNFLMCAHA